jgi:hypothetical protein
MSGRLKFNNSVAKINGINPSSLIPIKIQKNHRELEEWKKRKHRGFLVIEYDTFVQAGVDQEYPFVTIVPDDTKCYLTWCSFQYAQSLSRFQNFLSIISRKIGLIQYTLKHAIKHHTVEDVFWIDEK